jgi:hypothetical protein
MLFNLPQNPKRSFTSPINLQIFFLGSFIFFFYVGVLCNSVSQLLPQAKSILKSFTRCHLVSSAAKNCVLYTSSSNSLKRISNILSSNFAYSFPNLLKYLNFNNTTTSSSAFL